MERTITIDGREVRLRASASIPRLYRIKFHRDIIHDMDFISKSICKSIRNREMAEEPKRKDMAQQTDTLEAPDESPVQMEASDIPIEALTMFENVAYLMAKHADPTVPSSPDEWLEGFETFSIYQVFPIIQDMWETNLRTMVMPTKK